jgi:hypothetical protein
MLAVGSCRLNASENGILKKRHLKRQRRDDGKKREKHFRRGNGSCKCPEETHSLTWSKSSLEGKAEGTWRRYSQRCKVGRLPKRTCLTWEGLVPYLEGARKATRGF